MYNVCMTVQEKEDAELMAFGNFNATDSQDDACQRVVLLNEMCLCMLCLSPSWPIALFRLSSS